VWFFIPVGGFVFGAAIGRWWTLLAAAPLGAYVLASNDLEGDLGGWVALMLSLLLALAIAAGVALKKLLRASRRSRLGA
jgi:hypothetical protein